MVDLSHSDYLQLVLSDQRQVKLWWKGMDAPGPTSREALRLRLVRTGKTWTVQQYIYASLILFVAMTLLVWLKSGSLPLGLGVGVVVGDLLADLARGQSFGHGAPFRPALRPSGT